MTDKRHGSQGGFTLIEMAISMMVIGVLLGGVFQIYQQYKNERTLQREERARDRITSALAAYAEANNRLPCPANPALPPSNNNFGVEGVAGCPAGAGVAQGMVPVHALNLPYHLAADAYGNKMTYAVTASLTQANGMTDAAAVRVTDRNGQQRNMPFILVSHGRDGKGAYGLLSSSIGVPCTGSGADVENCDGDNVFRDMEYADIGDPANANHFDDHVVYSLTSRETSAWVAAPTPTGLGIGNKNNANVGIGVPSPAEKLHVQGEVLVDSASSDIEVRASNKIDVQRTSPTNGGEIHSDGSVEALDEIKGSKIRAGIFTYK